MGEMQRPDSARSGTWPQPVRRSEPGWYEATHQGPDHIISAGDVCLSAAKVQPRPVLRTTLWGTCSLCWQSSELIVGDDGDGAGCLLPASHQCPWFQLLPRRLYWAAEKKEEPFLVSVTRAQQ